MTVYTPKQLQQLLCVGRDTAYSIMKAYGFRTGDTERSPLRITEKEVERYVEDARRTAGTRLDKDRE